MTNTRFLLDTHVWIWLVAGEGKISPKLLSLIQTASDASNLHLSDISLWEISMLVKKERIVLDQPVLTWIRTAIKLSGVHLARLTPEITVESTELPGVFHGDPADRLIVATARIMNLTLITRDEKILEYGLLKPVQTLAI